MNKNVAGQRVSLERLRVQSVEHLKKEGPHPYSLIAGTSHRIRLLRFFAKYNEGRIDDVDALLRRWHGVENSLWPVLVAKYGPEPPPPTKKDATVEAPAEAKFIPITLEERIYAMYHEFNPSKLSDLPDVLKKYIGHEIALLHALIRKYGQEPHIALQQANGTKVKVITFRDRLEDMYMKYQPEKIREMEQLLLRFAGQERRLLHNMVLKFGPEPKGPYEDEPEEELKPLTTRDRLRGFLLHHDKSQLGVVDTAMQRFHNNEGEMFTFLTAKYGPEPTRKQIEALLHPSTLHMDNLILQGAAPIVILPKREDKAKELYDAAMAKGGFDEATDALFHAHLKNNFTLFEPEFLPSTSHFIQAFEVNERNELAEYIRGYYKTAEPVQHHRKFQEQIHFLHMLHNCDEVNEVGGVQAYARIIAHDRYSVVLHQLQKKYGSIPTMTEIAFRNRLKHFFVAYNPQHASDADRILSKFKGDEETLYKALKEKYGEEPGLPEDIDQKRVVSFLQIRVPELMQQVDDAIDSHCAIGAGSNEVLHALEESFGPEPTPADKAFMDAKVRIMMQRCRSGVNEIQLRSILARKEHADRIALENQEFELEEAVSIFQKAAVPRAGVLDKFKKAAKKVGALAASLVPLDVLASRKAEHDVEKQEKLKKVLKELCNEEEMVRLTVIQGEFEAHEKILKDINSKVDVSHGLKTMPMLELIKRQAWEEDNLTEWQDILQDFASEMIALDSQIRDKLVWRERWENWEAFKAAKTVIEADTIFDEAEDKSHLLAETNATVERQQDLRAKGFARNMESMERLLNDQNSRVVKYEADFEHARRNIHHRMQSPTPGDVETIHLPIAESVGNKKAPEHALHKGTCVLPRFNVVYDGVAVLAQVPRISPEKPMVRLVAHKDYRPPNEALPFETVRLSKLGQDEDAFRKNCQEYLVSIFGEYAPHRLGEVKTLMGQFVGREEALMGALEQQYGMVDGQTFDVALDCHEETTRHRLTAFFEKYDRAMVEQVDYVLEEYAGMEDQMWTTLEKAYGPENLHQREVTMAEGRALLIGFYEARSPAMVSQVDYIIREYEGNFNLLDVQLRKKYGSGFL